MAITQDTGWAWIGPDGKPRKEIFNTPNDAIEEMKRRQGDPDFCITKSHEVGFKLAFVKITVEPVLILDEPA